MWNVAGMILTRENWMTRREICPIATLPNTGPTWILPWERTRVSAVRNRRQTSWAMAQPRTSLWCDSVSVASLHVRGQPSGRVRKVLSNGQRKSVFPAFVGEIMWRECRDLLKESVGTDVRSHELARWLLVMRDGRKLHGVSSKQRSVNNCHLYGRCVFVQIGTWHAQQQKWGSVQQVCVVYLALHPAKLRVLAKCIASALKDSQHVMLLLLSSRGLRESKF